ncbi:hypothetical protein WJX77_003336 [Trebouxia sp. C0004]
MNSSERTKAVMDYLQSRQAKGENQEQPQSERSRGSGRGQANYVDRNRGITTTGGHRWRECQSLPQQYRPAPQTRGGPGRGRGRGRGMAGRSWGRGYGY